MIIQLFKNIGLTIAVVLCSTQITTAQTAFHNFGDIQIHEDAQIGFHTHLINDGMFDNNLGLAGFYGNTQLNVSGTAIAEFYNAEIDIIDGLNLQTSMGVYNHLDFINGKVFTPRNDLGVSLDFLNAAYAGDGDAEHVDGYAGLFGNIDFTFPVGDADKLRPLTISEPNAITTFKSAYFFEDPNTPSTFATQFDTESHSPILSKINDKEFWDLNGNQEVEVTLTWDDDSDISNLTNDINYLKIVGWSETTLRWVDLGRNDVSGDFNSGSLTSNAFIPDDYVALTIGTEHTGEMTLNTGFSPNGDGMNDYFEIEGLDLTQDNDVEIFDRWGNVIYIKDNYDNLWGGISENGNTYKKGTLVPVGTYYYIFKIKDKFTGELKTYKGWIYINY